MSNVRSYLAKAFVVTDPDARIRKAGDLMTFDRYAAGDALPAGAKIGDFKRIPAGTRVRVDRIEIASDGSSTVRIFAHATSPDGNTAFGWTSTRNFEGMFVNETLGDIPPAPGAGKYGPNAAWKAGAYIGQKTLVRILDVTFDIERICLDTLDPYLALSAAAGQDSVQIALTSGFRTYGQQKYLHDGWTKKLPGFNPAAPPGTSLHQNGIAFDLAVAGGAGNPTYDWLARHATRHGFLRTVNKEPWHWEYDPPRAAVARQGHTFKTPNVKI